MKRLSPGAHVMIVVDGAVYEAVVKKHVGKQMRCRWVKPPARSVFAPQRAVQRRPAPDPLRYHFYSVRRNQEGITWARLEDGDALRVSVALR